MEKLRKNEKLLKIIVAVVLFLMIISSFLPFLSL